MDFLFKKLIVWQRAMEFAKLVYDLVKKLPAEERFALADQLRRSAVSIPSNIAEGNGRAGNRDYSYFIFFQLLVVACMRRLHSLNSQRNLDM